MYVIVKNGTIQQTIRPNRAFEYNGIRYNERWSQRMSREDKAALGIMEVVQGPRADERFYWVSPSSVRILNGVPTQTYSAIAKDLDTLKADLTAQEKANANNALAETDWMVIRKAERGVDLPEETKAQRQAILDTCAKKEAAISAATTVEELIDVVAPGAVKAPVEEVVAVVTEQIQALSTDDIVALTTDDIQVLSGNAEGNSDV